MSRPFGWTTKTFLVSVGVSAAFVMVSVVFANVTSSSRVADNAKELHWANATLGTAALARAAAGQAAMFSDLAASDLASNEAVAVAGDELSRTTTALAELVGANSSLLHPELGALLDSLTVKPVDPSSIDRRYSTVAALLADRISELEDEIQRSERLAGYTSGAIRVLITLFFPATAILFYRRRANAQLQAAEVRVEAELAATHEISRAKDQFVAGMSHEIRTPLTGIYGFSEVLMNSDPEDGFDREVIAMIHEEAAELSRMVDDFIAVARIDGETLEVEQAEFDLLSLVRSIAERFRRREVDVGIEGEPLMVMGDEGRVTQILTNLIANASRHGGPTISVSIEEDTDHAWCRVSDNGDGVSPDREAMLFTRFVNDETDVLTTGSLGLGTWVARQLARAMDGDVTYQRSEGLSVFSLTLPTPPLAAADVEARHPAAVSS